MGFFSDLSQVHIVLRDMRTQDVALWQVRPMMIILLTHLGALAALRETFVMNFDHAGLEINLRATSAQVAFVDSLLCG